MHKILIKVTKNDLCFSTYNKETDNANLNNTNIINTKNIIFTDEYIIENMELVSAFLNVVILKNNVTNIVVKDIKLTKLVLHLTNYLPNLTKLHITSDENITSDLAEMIYSSKYLNHLNCFNISNFMFEKLNKKLTVEVRSELLFISNFMKANNIATYSDIYYKKNIIINTFDKNDLIDFETFLKVNKKLKSIDVKNYNDKDIHNIIECLIKNGKKNIKVNIYEENENISKSIDYLKKIQSIIKEKKIKIKIIYSDEYKEKYFLKQINLNLLTTSLFIMITLIIGIIIIYKFFDFKANDEIKQVQEKIEKIDKEPIPVAKTEIKKEENEYNKKYSKILSELKKINNETIGWLKVNNTNVDYPVVKHNDNSYYLNHSFSKKANQNGWLFADYRNKINPLDNNTIIYGHNDGNIMFGSLKKVLNKSWYTNSSNHTITFDTGSGSSKWKLFSIYTTPVTNDYLVVNFKHQNNYNDFLQTIKQKSIYNFNTDINSNDKILTLSTCYNNSDNRLVVHAKKIA